MNPDDLAREISVGRVPPIGIDGQRRDIDAPFVHGPESEIAQDIPVWEVPVHGGARDQRRHFLEYAVRVDVHRSNLVASYHDPLSGPLRSGTDPVT